MKPGLRKFALTAHVTFSVGWFGAVAGFLALSIAGLASQDPQRVRATYFAMDLTNWFVILPLAFASFFTGLVSSLGTRWGLFQYYWVLVKLLITILATLILLIHTPQISLLGGAAAKQADPGAELNQLQLQMVVASGAALVVLVVLTALSVYKPRGLTRYGYRKQAKDYTSPDGRPTQARMIDPLL